MARDGQAEVPSTGPIMSIQLLLARCASATGKPHPRNPALNRNPPSGSAAAHPADPMFPEPCSEDATRRTEEVFVAEAGNDPTAPKPQQGDPARRAMKTPN